MDNVKKEHPSHSMGMHATLISLYSTFVRQFRFLLSGEHLDDAYTKSMKVNYIKKTIKLKAYEISVPQKEGGTCVPVIRWADAIQAGQHPNETLLLVTLDGCGDEIYRRRFSGLKIVNRKHEF